MTHHPCYVDAYTEASQGEGACRDLPPLAGTVLLVCGSAAFGVQLVPKDAANSADNAHNAKCRDAKSPIKERKPRSARLSLDGIGSAGRTQNDPLSYINKALTASPT